MTRSTHKTLAPRGCSRESQGSLTMTRVPTPALPIPTYTEPCWSLPIIITQCSKCPSPKTTPLRGEHGDRQGRGWYADKRISSKLAIEKKKTSRSGTLFEHQLGLSSCHRQHDNTSPLVKFTTGQCLSKGSLKHHATNTAKFRTLCHVRSWRGYTYEIGERRRQIPMQGLLCFYLEGGLQSRYCKHVGATAIHQNLSNQTQIGTSTLAGEEKVSVSCLYSRVILSMQCNAECIRPRRCPFSAQGL